MADKIVFLDIDGVLNGHKRDPGIPYCWIHQDLVMRLNEITDRTRAKLVISSAWRYMIQKDTMTVRGFNWLLKSHRVHADVIDITKRDEQIPEREDQINDWIKRNKPWSYVVLDDDPMKMVGNARFIRTDPCVGLSERNVEDAIRWLNRKILRRRRVVMSVLRKRKGARE